MSRLRNAMWETLRRVHAAPVESAPPDAWYYKGGVGPFPCPLVIGLVCYALLWAAQFTLLIQLTMDPSLGGLAGATTSAALLLPVWAWGVFWTALGWSAIAVLARRAALNIWPLRKTESPVARTVIGAAAVGTSAGLAAWLFWVGPAALLWILTFFAAPAGALIAIRRMQDACRKVVIGALAATITVVLLGWGLLSIERNALHSLAERERGYAEIVVNSSDYVCDLDFERVSRIRGVDRLGDNLYRARARISQRLLMLTIPSYAVSVYFADETTTTVRPDYMEACLNAKDIRAEEIGETGGAYLAPWRWRRSADGGASWADVPHSLHRQSAETEGYTYRYAPTKADLADANILLRACVDIRGGGGEVCAPGVSPRP